MNITYPELIFKVYDAELMTPLPEIEDVLLIDLCDKLIQITVYTIILRSVVSNYERHRTSQKIHGIFRF